MKCRIHFTVHPAAAEAVVEVSVVVVDFQAEGLVAAVEAVGNEVKTTIDAVTNIVHQV